VEHRVGYPSCAWHEYGSELLPPFLLIVLQGLRQAVGANFTSSMVRLPLSLCTLVEIPCNYENDTQ
jgi:hypothetical protein